MGTFLLASVATLVFCAPGYPGGAGDAQPFIEKFASAAAAGAGWPATSLAAVYEPTEQGGLTKLAAADTVLAFIPYAFYVQHGAQLHLSPLVQANVVGVGAEERWSLVAKSGAAADPSSLAGMTLESGAGYAPDFVRRSALSGWILPSDLKIESNGQILSVLRRVASGEHVVALLDQTQATAMPTLPFAAKLKTLMQSPPLPVALIAVIDGRLPVAKLQVLKSALLKMGRSASDADTLAALRLQGFMEPQLPKIPAAP